MYSVPSHRPFAWSSRFFWTVAVMWAAIHAVLGLWCRFMYSLWLAEFEPMSTFAPLWLMAGWVWWIVGLVVVPRSLVRQRPRPAVILALQGAMLVLLLSLAVFSERGVWRMMYEQHGVLGVSRFYPVVALVIMITYTWYLRRLSTNLNPAKVPERT